jgi:ribosomal protein S1
MEQIVRESQNRDVIVDINAKSEGVISLNGIPVTTQH